MSELMRRDPAGAWSPDTITSGGGMHATTRFALIARLNDQTIVIDGERIVAVGNGVTTIRTTGSVNTYSKLNLKRLERRPDDGRRRHQERRDRVPASSGL